MHVNKSYFSLVPHCLSGGHGTALTSKKASLEAVRRELESKKKRKQVLEGLLHAGKISRFTYDYLNGAITAAIRDHEEHLKTLTDQEEDTSILVSPPPAPPAVEDSTEQLKEKGKTVPKVKKAPSRRRTKRASTDGSSPARVYSKAVSEGRCRNPWNGRCRNSDIEVSIYYKNELLPICRECWQDISNRDLTW